MLHVLAQLSGATAYGAFLGCVIAAAFAIGSLDAEPAVRLARILALVGGSAVLVASSSSTLYSWIIGSASARSALLVEMADDPFAAPLHGANLAASQMRRKRFEIIPDHEA